MSGVLKSTDEADWKRIACIPLDRITDIHIANLLLAHGIQSVTPGSRVYAVEVPTDRAELATQLLRSDARNGAYQISFENGDMVETPKLRRVIRRTPVTSVLKRRAYSSQTALGRFLRSDQILALTAK